MGTDLRTGNLMDHAQGILLANELLLRVDVRRILQMQNTAEIINRPSLLFS